MLTDPRHVKAPVFRRKPERVKESIVRFKGYENKVLVGEEITEIEYQPHKCSRPYRLIIVRDPLRVVARHEWFTDNLNLGEVLLTKAPVPPLPCIPGALFILEEI